MFYNKASLAILILLRTTTRPISYILINPVNGKLHPACQFIVVVYYKVNNAPKQNLNRYEIELQYFDNAGLTCSGSTWSTFGKKILTMKQLNWILFILITTVLNLSAQEPIPESYASLLATENVLQPLIEGEEKNVGFKWEFILPEINTKQEDNNSESGNYRLGAENSHLKDYITQTYTRAEPIAPGNPMTRIVISKPAIFNAVKTIEKYYFKSIKGNELTQQEAEVAYRKVLQVAIAAISENSESFENALQAKRRSAIGLIQLFNLVKLKQM